MHSARTKAAVCGTTQLAQQRIVWLCADRFELGKRKLTYDAFIPLHKCALTFGAAAHSIVSSVADEIAS